jgi:hypothetical protein
MFVRSDKSAGGLKLRSWKSLLIASTFPRIVAERELSSSVSFSIKHVTNCSNPGSLPQGSVMWFLLVNSIHLACLNHSVSASTLESGHFCLNNIS